MKERHPTDRAPLSVSFALHRRAFIGLAACGVARAVAPGPSRASSVEAGAEPHHFLLVWAQGGWDPAYLADATPLELTAAGLQHNYLGVEPERWEDADGRTTYVSAPFHRNLSPFRDRLTVLNGVLMATSFDGHFQNTNYLLTGSPFGGASFLPDLSHGTPLDYVRLDLAPGAVLSFEDVVDSRQVPLSPDSALELTKQLQLLPPLTEESPLRRFLAARYAENGRRDTAFAGGARALEAAVSESASLRARLSSLELDAPGLAAPPLTRNLSLLAELFRKQVASSAFLSLPDTSLDTHSASTAARQPEAYEELTSEIASVLTFLRDTAYDTRRNLLDVTTVMFASEFGRTMRQANLPITETGTDHNPLSNTLLLAGKGVRPGCLFGGSDLGSPGEMPSAAHRAFDPERLKRMGRPIDFATGRPVDAGAGDFRPEQHLTIHSVVNTLADLFGAPRQARRDLGRSLPRAPSLPFLLA